MSYLTVIQISAVADSLLSLTHHQPDHPAALPSQPSLSIAPGADLILVNPRFLSEAFSTHRDILPSRLQELHPPHITIFTPSSIGLHLAFCLLLLQSWP